MAPLQNKLRSVRSEMGLTQQEVASRAGVSRQAYMSIEASRSSPSTEVALKLARVLSRPVEDLFSLAADDSAIVEAELVGESWQAPANQRVELAEVVEDELVVEPVARGAARR